MLSFLVVDDDRDAADCLADVFRLAGHDCIVAYDGRSALDEERRFHVDVVILDIHMPGLDGYETARCFLNSQELRRPLLIALTAHASSEARVNAMRAGFDGFLAKPINPHRLLDLVDKLSNEQRASLLSAPPAASSTSLESSLESIVDIGPPSPANLEPLAAGSLVSQSVARSR